MDAAPVLRLARLYPVLIPLHERETPAPVTEAARCGVPRDDR
jgi:hypothetical protein